MQHSNVRLMEPISYIRISEAQKDLTERTISGHSQRLIALATMESIVRCFAVRPEPPLDATDVEMARVRRLPTIRVPRIMFSSDRARESEDLLCETNLKFR